MKKAGCLQGSAEMLVKKYVNTKNKQLRKPARSKNKPDKIIDILQSHEDKQQC